LAELVAFGRIDAPEADLLAGAQPERVAVDHAGRLGGRPAVAVKIRAKASRTRITLQGSGSQRQQYRFSITTVIENNQRGRGAIGSDRGLDRQRPDSLLDRVQRQGDDRHLPPRADAIRSAAAALRALSSTDGRLTAGGWRCR
jgi:hypothetical protein